MLRFLLVTLLFTLFGIVTIAQSSTINGMVTDEAKQSPIQGATVLIYLQRDTVKKAIQTTVTDIKGSFSITNLPSDSFFIAISAIGFETIKKAIVTRGGITNAGKLQFIRAGKDLDVIITVSKASPVLQKADTTEFSALQFKVNPDATTEDLIKKMPGITVAKDGTVTAQGEQVKKVTIDGKDFFGDDATAALRNLPSEIVDKIQVFDRLSDQAQLTGFDDGNSVKALNIVTKSGIKNGQFGRLYSGYGTDDRYSAGGNISFFKGNRRISLIGNFNNTNQQNFGTQDLLGLTSSAGRGGGGGRGGSGRGGGGGSDNFTVGPTSGISNTNAAGLNFSNQYGKKLTITGSYFFNNSTNNNLSLVNTETFANPKNQFSVQNSNSAATNNNHRINMRLEYKLDSFNTISIIPNISFQNNNSSTLSNSQNFYGANDSVNTSLNNSRSNRQGFNIRNSILFHHAFRTRGRSLSFGINTTFTKNDGESFTDAQYRFFKTGFITDSLQNQFYNNTSNGNTLGATISYTEPIGKKGQLQIDYTPSVQKNKADQQTFLLDGGKYTKFDPTLSNQFENTITTNNAGINYRLGQSRDDQFNIGVNFQHSTLQSQRIYPITSTVNQTFSNILPNLRWMKKITSRKNIRLFYRASTVFPSINQLQDVVNLSNPLRVSSGNPDLNQSYTHLVSGRYTYTNSKTGSSFFANLFLQTASDYISNATYIATADSVIQQQIILKRGSQLTKPVNLDGYKSLRTFFTYSLPVKAIKTTVNINAGFSYSKLPGLSNYKATTTNSYTYNTGVVLASNISEYVDFNLSYSANISNAQTIANTTINNKYFNQSAGFQINLLNKKGWFIQNDLSNQSYSGLTDGLNQSYWLWNAATGKKFGKKKDKELRLSVFDLLKQNQSIARTITGAYIEDVQSQVLQQYFMLTFSYSLKNFGVPARPTNGGFTPMRDGMMRPGGGNSPF
jgi:hypothetical protein